MYIDIYMYKMGGGGLGYSFNTVMVVCITFITIKTRLFSLTLSLYTHNRKERTHSSIQQELFNLNPMLVHTCTAVESRQSTGHCEIIQGTVLGIVGTH